MLKSTVLKKLTSRTREHGTTDISADYKYNLQNVCLFVLKKVLVSYLSISIFFYFIFSPILYFFFHYIHFRALGATSFTDLDHKHKLLNQLL